MSQNAAYDYRPYLIAPTVFATRREALEALNTIKRDYPHTRVHLDIWGILTASRGWPPVGATPHADERYARKPPESVAEKEAAGNPPFRAYLHAVVSAAATEAHFRDLAREDPAKPDWKRNWRPRYLEVAERARTLPDNVEERFALAAKEKDEAGLSAWPDGPWVEGRDRVPDDAQFAARMYLPSSEEAQSQ